MARFRYFLFLALVSYFIVLKFGIGGTAVKGLSLKNAIFYVTLLSIFLIQAAERRPFISGIPGGIYIILLIGYAGFTILISSVLPGKAPPKMEMIHAWKSELADPFFLYAACCLIFRNKEEALSAMRLMVIIFGVLNIICLFSFITGMQLPIDVIREGSGGWRYTGYMGISNQGAYALIFMLPFAYYFLRESRKTVMKLLYLVIILTSVAGVLPTGSRGGTMTMTAIILLFSYLRSEYRLVGYYFGMIFLFGMLLTITHPENLIKLADKFSVFMEAEGDINEITHGRSQNWVAILEILASNPLAIVSGIGWGTYFANIRTGAAHNEYLLLIFQLGAVGFIFFLLSVLSYVRVMKRYEQRKTDMFYKCMICSLFVLFANAMFGVVQMAFYAYTLGIGISYILLERREAAAAALERKKSDLSMQAG
jgi:hypothetical protein